LTKKFIYHFVLLFASFALLFFSCKPSLRYFSNDPNYKGKYLLTKQSVQGTKKLSEDELGAYIKQKSNRNILGFQIYLGLYYFGKSWYDTLALQKQYNRQENSLNKRIEKATTDKKKNKWREKKNKRLSKSYKKLTEGNWVMRTVGEAPVVFDSLSSIESVRNIHRHLKSKGFLENDVTWSVKYKKRKAKVTYVVREKEPYLVRNILYDISDTRIDSINTDSKGGSELSSNIQYNEKNLSDERDRLFSILKNKGYYKISKQNIYYTIDSSLNTHQLDITLHIHSEDSSQFTVFHIDEAAFFAEVSQGSSMPDNDQEIKDGIITYQLYGRKYNTKILSRKIYLKKREIYDQRKIESIQRRLGTLDMFRLVNIKPDLIKNDTLHADSLDTGANALKIYIYTSPLKKYQLSQEYGLSVGQGYIPGPFLNVTFKTRNVFKNFEIFETFIRYSLEGQASALDVDNVLTTQQFNSGISLTFPSLLFPGLRNKVERSAPRSRLLVGYGFIDRYEYRRTFLNGSLSYFFLGKNKFSQFGITPIDVYVVNSIIKTNEFKRYLDTLRSSGNNLYVTFRQSIVTNFNFYYAYNNFQFGTNKPSFFFKPYVEIGGNVPNLISKYITNEQENKLFNLQYFEYLKFQLDLRGTRPLGKKHSLAAKLIAGLVRPYGSSGYTKAGSYILPYEKYFFSGGTSSIRAWQPRRLGPGAYKDLKNGSLFEQPGEILLETSIEYRFKIYWFLEGAVFVDAGNVWTLKDPTRAGSEFKYFESIPDIAVGTGYGVRLNFTFLIIRFDMGYKLLDPSEPLGQRYVLRERITKSPTFNIGIGYPF
jgi:outer membrane protein insertion porin family